MNDNRLIEDDLEPRLRGALHEIGDDVLRILSAEASAQDLEGPRQQRRRSAIPLLATAAVAVVISAAVASPLLVDTGSDHQPAGEGSTTSSDGSLSSRPGMRSAVDRVSARVSKLWREPGYGKVSVDYENATVLVFWRGSTPADLEKLRGTTIDGVEVRVVDVPYSDHDMAVAARKVLHHRETSMGAVMVSHTFPSKDFAALVAVVSRTERNPDAAALAKSLTKIAGIPVMVEFTKDEFFDGPWRFRNR